MKRTSLSGHLSRLGLCVALASVSCSQQPASTHVTPTSTTPPPDNTTPPTGALFEAASVYSQVAKVKGLLVGQAPTDEEVKAVTADAKALRTLIERWMSQPEYQAKMLVFFRNAFQQGQIGLNDFTDQLPVAFKGNAQFQQRLLRDFQESFARTVWQLVLEGRPFNEVVTTRRYMLTPPLMAVIAYMDQYRIDDKNGRLERVMKLYPKFAVTIHNTGAPIPLSETLDPNSPNFMHWNSTIPIPAGMQPGCYQDPRVIRSTVGLFGFLFGQLDTLGQTICQPNFYGAAQFTDTEFDDWRMVTIRAPKNGEAPTSFYDIPTLRAASELVLTVPRVGFFTTPAFFANWQTNVSNLARVTMNQTLIVALGASFDDSNNITAVSETALDKEHAAPGTACYACHKTLDPMRQFFRQAFSLYYHEQSDPVMMGQPGVFAYGGITAQGRDIFDMASMLATHPRFAPAWTQKLCFFANSAACSEDDPEFVRISEAFVQSGYNFSTLMLEMMASPLTTSAANTKTFDDRGVVISVSRRDAFCTELSNRLGINDICGLVLATRLTQLQNRLLSLSTGLPNDGYSRGSVAPVLSNDPSLFFRASTENVCRTIADYVVDVGVNGTSRYSSMKPDPAIADMTHNVMGLTSVDPRAAQVQQILTDHFAAAQKAGLKPVDALKSTFVLACESPTSVAIGL